MPPVKFLGKRVLAAVAIGVALSLTSSIAWATWTTAVPRSASVQAATVSISSTGISNLTTTYSALSLTKVVAVSVANTGTAPLALSSVTVSNTTGTLPAAILLAIWPKTTGTCPAEAPLVALTRTLASGVTATLPATAFPIPLAGADFCMATTLTGALLALAGQSTAPTITLAARVGDNWVASDVSATRSFTVNAPLPVPAPNITCANSSYGIFWNQATISWSAPTGITVTGYQVYVDGVAFGAPQTARSIVFNLNNVSDNGSATVTVRTITAAGSSLDSTGKIVIASNGFLGGTSVRCG